MKKGTKRDFLTFTTYLKAAALKLFFVQKSAYAAGATSTEKRYFEHI